MSSNKYIKYESKYVKFESENKYFIPVGKENTKIIVDNLSDVTNPTNLLNKL